MLSASNFCSQKLEAQKKDMACRIMELEKELAYLNNNQKEKVAENVEYIRVWRQMKQLNDKLMTTQEKNTALTTEINDLKTTLEQTTRYSLSVSYLYRHNKLFNIYLKFEYYEKNYYKCNRFLILRKLLFH